VALLMLKHTASRNCVAVDTWAMRRGRYVDHAVRSSVKLPPFDAGPVPNLKTSSFGRPPKLKRLPWLTYHNPGKAWTVDG
jgi:hypothetical protein